MLSASLAASTEVGLPSLSNAGIDAGSSAAPNLGSLGILVHQVSSDDLNVLLLLLSSLSELAGELVSEVQPGVLGSLSLLSELALKRVVTLNVAASSSLAVNTTGGDASVPLFGVAGGWGGGSVNPGSEGINGWSQDSLRVSLDSEASGLNVLSESSDNLLNFWLVGLLVSPLVVLSVDLFHLSLSETDLDSAVIVVWCGVVVGSSSSDEGNVNSELHW